MWDSRSLCISSGKHTEQHKDLSPLNTGTGKGQVYLPNILAVAMLIKQQRVQNGREPILQWESPIPFCPWGSSVHPTEPLLPFYSTHHGDGLTPVLLAGHTIEWMTHTMLLSKLQEAPSAGSALLAPLRQFHPCFREHNWAKWQQAQWVPGGSVIPTSKLSILVSPWAEFWLSPAPGGSQALCFLVELHIFAFPESWACWGTEHSEASGRCTSGVNVTHDVIY